MKLLFVGDVVSSVGCDDLRQKLPALKRQYGIDLTVVNAENSAVGNGVLPASADFLFASGADVLTGGNHSFKRREIYSYLEDHPQLLRPANFPAECPGSGVYVYDMGRWRIAIVSLMGNVFLEPLESPFLTLERILQQTEADFFFVDFHAEATGEKKALAYHFDGRIQGLFGTHTHVQTADEQILEQGTAYITDLGMTGPIHSVLGVKAECIIQRYRTALPTRFEAAEGECRLNGVLVTLDERTKRCTEIVRLSL